MTVKEKNTSFELPIVETSVEAADSDSPAEHTSASPPKTHWRSLEDLTGNARSRDLTEHEFPDGADQLLDPVSRRGFMKVMGASFALAGLSACVHQPDEKIIPYVKQPEEIIPGRPLFFATTTTLGGFASGVVVESHDGRPTRVAGNVEHPGSLGGVDVFSQAEILQMYDPDRSQKVIHNGENSGWNKFAEDINRRVTTVPAGNGVALLLGAIGSPALRKGIARFQESYPDARVYTYEPTPIASREEIALLDVEKADVIVALDADFLSGMPNAMAYANAFGNRRDPELDADNHNRLYVAEPTPTATGGIADHRIAVRATEIFALAQAIAEGIGAEGAGGGSASGLSENVTAWVAAVVDDLKKSRGKGVVTVGESQPEAVHAIVRSINGSIGAIGSTIKYVPSPVTYSHGPLGGIKELADAASRGEITTLIISGSNPMYDSPGDIDFKRVMEAIPLRVHHGLYFDETAFWSHWHVPATHQFEMWGDGVDLQGTYSVSQPLIAPLYSSTKSLAQIIALLNGQTAAKDYDLILGHWTEDLGRDEKSWRKALHDGYDSQSLAAVASAAPTTGTEPAVVDTEENRSTAPAVVPVTTSGLDTPPSDEGGIEVNFRPDPTLFDGRYNNNGWLQELPKPITKLVWDNAVLMNARMAAENDLENGEIVRIDFQGRSVEGPIWITPGQADNSVTMHFGYGRERSGRVGDGTGFNVYPLRSTTAPWFGTGATMTKTGEEMLLVSTQDHWSLEGRNLYRQVTLEDMRSNSHIIEEMEHIHEDNLSFYSSADWEYNGYAWGMTIDLNRCTSCNACVIACQSENNIPVIGKGEVSNGREMHWIRIDRYFGGDPMDNDSVEIYNQPVPCMQCEQAPCEVVCPVAATVHSAEGLNDMVYNRCVGTRYCSNNCPYKVRRFNFLQYVDEDTEQFKLMRNPDVSVRTRGVMEKCTYCVQRINEARIDSKVSGEQIPTDSIITACQQACPTNAIAFGDINNPESTVTKLKASPRNYGMLKELNTRPRTTYLARMRNTHESLKPAEDAGENHH